MVADIFQGKLETFGEAESVREGVGLIAEKLLHFRRALEMALRVFR